MRLGIQELCDRYNVKSRKSVYSRLDSLGITLDKNGNKSYATKEQIELLDQQDKYIKDGGILKHFVPTTQAQVAVDSTPHPSDTVVTTGTVQLSTQSEAIVALLGDMVNKTASAIAEKMATPNPTWYVTELERIRTLGVSVPTSEIKALIKVKPTLKKGEETFERGSYVYVPGKKIGKETGWRVFRKTDNRVEYKVEA